MKYVDVILPLPLPGLFTYSVPEGMEGRVVFGKRLLVPLGRSKKYIGMAVNTRMVRRLLAIFLATWLSVSATALSMQ
jgi:primosomal protein N'